MYSQRFLKIKDVWKKTFFSMVSGEYPLVNVDGGFSNLPVRSTFKLHAMIVWDCRHQQWHGSIWTFQAFLAKWLGKMFWFGFTPFGNVGCSETKQCFFRCFIDRTYSGFTSNFNGTEFILLHSSVFKTHLRQEIPPFVSTIQETQDLQQ